MLPHIENMLTEYLSSIHDVHHKIQIINELKLLLHRQSPFSCEPVDCVTWVEVKSVQANDYNPNVMATVEKKLLKRSIIVDGFTQPVVVASQQKQYLVVDGFHRHLLAQKCPELKHRLYGYLPVTLINPERQGEKERIAATIRHNRARGKHQITPMSDIVRDLYRLGWDTRQIGEELGMDADEVLRLNQISGLSELFADENFSEAWTIK